MSLMQNLSVPHCTNLLYMFFYPVQLHFGQHYFRPLGFCNIVTERWVPFLTRQIEVLGVELINQDTSNIFWSGKRDREWGMEGRKNGVSE